MRACMLSHFRGVRLFVTAWTVACKASLSIGFSRQGYWSELPCPHPGNLPDPGIYPVAPALQADFLLLSHQENPRMVQPSSKDQFHHHQKKPFTHSSHFPVLFSCVSVPAPGKHKFIFNLYGLVCFVHFM